MPLTARRSPGAAVVILAAFLIACDTPQSRIKRNQALFESLPPDAQRKIRSGQVDIGFTKEMVLMALGRPTIRYDRASGGAMEEVWVYREGGGGSNVGLSIGGAVGSSVGIGGGIGVGDGPGGARDRARVVFENGRVVEAELAS